MNRKIALALVAVATAFAGTAFAEDYNGYNPHAQSSRSRSAVQAELAQFKQSGVNPSSMAYNPLRGFHGTATREQVAADYRASRDVVAAFTGEDSGSAYLARRGAASRTTLAGAPSAAL